MQQMETIQGGMLQVGSHTVQVGGLRLRHTYRWLRQALCLSVTGPVVP